MSRLKLGSFLLIFILLFSSCSKKSITTIRSNDSQTILFLVFDLTDPFVSNIAKQAENYAKENQISLTIEDSENSIEKQVQQIKQAKTEGYGAIICVSVDQDTSLQLITAADGLPIVFVNRRPDSNLLEKDHYIYVGSDENISGQYQAEYLADKFQGKNSFRAVLLQGEKGQDAAITRTESVKYQLKKAGFQVEYVFEDRANWNREQAKEMFLTFLSLEEPFDCVICNNDEMALGVIDACIERQIDPSKIPILGIDATEEACEAIKNGSMAFTVKQSAENQGKYAVIAAKTILEEGKIEEIEYISEDGCHIWIPFEKVDKNTLSQQ